MPIVSFQLWREGKSSCLKNYSDLRRHYSYCLFEIIFMNLSPFKISLVQIEIQVNWSGRWLTHWFGVSCTGRIDLGLSCCVSSLFRGQNSLFSESLWRWFRFYPLYEHLIPENTERERIQLTLQSLIQEVSLFLNVLFVFEVIEYLHLEIVDLFE